MVGVPFPPQFPPIIGIRVPLDFGYQVANHPRHRAMIGTLEAFQLNPFFVGQPNREFVFH